MSSLLPVQFRGVDQAADPKGQPPGTLVRAENCAMDKGRRLIKRAGTTGLVRTKLAGGSISTGAALVTRGDDTTVLDDEFLRAYSPDLAAWQDIGRPLRLGMTRRALVDSSRSSGAVDVALYGQLLVTVHTSGPAVTSSLTIQVENVETGTKVMPPTVIRTGGVSWPRVVISGTDAIVVYSTSAGDVQAAKVSLVTMTYTTVSWTLVSSTTASGPVDFGITTPASGVPTMYVAWTVGAGTDRLRVRPFLVSNFSAVGAGAATYATSSLTPVAVCVDLNASRMHVAASLFNSIFATNDVLVVTLTPSTMFSVASTSLPRPTLGEYATHAAVCEVNSTTVLVATVDTNGALTTALYVIVASTHTLTASTKRITWNAMAINKPWLLGSRWYVLATMGPHDYSLVSNTAIPNASSVVLEIETAATITGEANTPLNHVGTAESLTGWFSNTAGHLANAAVSSTVAYVPAAYRNQEPVNFQAIPVGWNLHRLDSAPAAPSSAVIGAGCLIAGAAPTWFDGASARPYGFVHAPKILGATVTAGGSMAVGRYTYVAVYEWRDAQGMLHRSPPSPPFSGTTAGANLSLSVAVSCSSLSQKQGGPWIYGSAGCANPVAIVLYRTTVGGSTYYRLEVAPSYQVLLNDPTLADVTIVDTKGDSNIGVGSPIRPLSAQPQLYTATGEVDDVPPPALIAVATHKGRLAGIDGTGRMVWFSKDQTQDPQVAPGFNEALTLGFASDKTALVSLGERLAVLGPASIDLVHGEGPDATGTGAWQIQGVQTDVGCINPRSVVAGAMGVLFQSSRGIELLGNDTLVSWVGKPIEDDLALFSTITSAVLVSEAHEIRFTCNAADGLTGIVLAWDYLHSIWFVRKYNDAANTAADSIPFADAALVGGVYTLLTAGGQVYQETTAHKLDGGTTYVAREVVLAWMSPSTPVGWHRVKDVGVMGTSVTDHDLSVSIARDFATTYEQTKTFLAQSDATTIGPLERCRVTLVNQKCRAVQIRLRDTVPTAPGALGTGDGPIWEGLAFRVMTKDGPAKTSSGRQG